MTSLVLVPGGGGESQGSFGGAARMNGDGVTSATLWASLVVEQILVSRVQAFYHRRA